jgi:ribosome recycling factor
MAKFDFDDIKRRMNAAVEDLKKEFSGLRTGRASASLLDPVMVSAYGNTVPLKQVANISVPESRLITVQVWDRSTLAAVEKAIRAAELGLNPVVDGQLIRLPIPDLTEERRRELTKLADLTEERRRELTKLAAKYAEQHRIAVRNVRRDGMEKLKALEKTGEISQDEHRKFSEQVQKETDAVIGRIDETLATKDREIMQV